MTEIYLLFRNHFQFFLWCVNQSALTVYNLFILLYPYSWEKSLVGGIEGVGDTMINIAFQDEKTFRLKLHTHQFLMNLALFKF